MKTKKSIKVISTVLSLLCIIPATGMTAFATEATDIKYDSNGFYENGDTTLYEPATDTNNDGCYEISNAGQLYWFSEQVDAGHVDYDAELTQDIVVNTGNMNENTVNAREWSPIGSVEERYKGTFNGNYYTISGLYFNDTSKDGIGLFEYTTTGGTIRDLTIENCYFNGYFDVAGICVTNEYGLIRNCYNKSAVICAKSNSASGICSNNHGTISNCTNTAKIFGRTETAGIVGFNTGTIEKSSNRGSVTGNYYEIAGVCACNHNGTISRCYNSGTITSETSTAGGICVDNNVGLIENCYNEGKVNAHYSAGGICASNNATIRNCHNIGVINSAYEPATGGICGELNDYFGGTIENCYNNIEISKVPAVKCGGEDLTTVYDKTSAEFASGEVTYLLNNGVTDGSQVWYQSLDIRDYPCFMGEIVYYESGTYTN